MNFYLVPLIFIALGIWVTAGLGGNYTEEEREMAIKNATQESRFPINLLPKIVSRIRAWAQSLRRLLKMLRKWWRSQPPEVKLGRCFANYFNIKIPQLRRYERVDGYNDNTKESKREPKRKRIYSDISNQYKLKNFVRQMKILKKSSDEKSPERTFISTFRDAYNRILEKFQDYRDIVYKNQLIVCLWDYFSKKFWAWIDSAPDSR